MHVVTNREGQKRMSFWHDMRFAKPEVMKQSLQHRRDGNLADNYQMKIDQDSYNENYNPGEAIQLIFDYTRDLEEMEANRVEENRKSA